MEIEKAGNHWFPPFFAACLPRRFEGKRRTEGFVWIDWRNKRPVSIYAKAAIRVPVKWAKELAI